jgi:CsoR family transcriptional regulator, copper-sensing transcriptional repressor
MSHVIEVEEKIHVPKPRIHHIHNPRTKKAVLNRLAKCSGHLSSVRKMIELDADSTEVLVQLSAVKSELNGISKAILQDHLTHCVIGALKEQDPESIDALNEAINSLLK